MYKVETDQTLQLVIQIFYKFGIWQKEEVSEFRRSGIRLFWFLKYISFLMFLLSCVFLNEEKDEKIYAFELFVTISVVVVKLTYLLYRKDEMLQFLNDPTVTHCITELEDLQEVKKKIKMFLRFGQFYTSVLIGSVSFLVVVPLPIFTSGNKLPLFIRFDVESDFDILYWLAFALCAMGTFFALVYNLVILIIWYVMFNHSIEYKLLGKQIARLGYGSRRNSFQRDLIDLIRAHRNIFEYECYTKIACARKRTKDFFSYYRTAPLSDTERVSLHFFWSKYLQVQ